MNNNSVFSQGLGEDSAQRTDIASRAKKRMDSTFSVQDLNKNAKNQSTENAPTLEEDDKLINQINPTPSSNDNLASSSDISLNHNDTEQTSQSESQVTEPISSKAGMANQETSIAEEPNLIQSKENSKSISESVQEDQNTSNSDELESADSFNDFESSNASEEQKANNKVNNLKKYAIWNKKKNQSEMDSGTAGEAVFDNSKRKKGLIAAGVILALLVCVYFGGALYFGHNKFLPNTYVNGENISNMNLDQAQETVSNLPFQRSITIIGRDGEKSEVNAEEIGFTLDETPDLSKQLQDQNPFSWPLKLLKSNSTNLDSASSINEEALTNTVANLNIVTGPQVVKTENARAEYDGEKFVAREEVYGTEVDVPKLLESVRQAFNHGNPMINLEQEEDYVLPVTHVDSEVLAQSIDKLNSLLGESITYDFKVSQEVVDKNVFLPWIGTTDTGEVYVNPDMVGAYVAGLAEKYDTVDKPVNFMTSGGTPVDLINWTSDWEINQPQEVADLTTNILSGQSVVKEPAYLQTGRDRAQQNTVTGTYLEISIPDQTMWYYKDGQLLVQTSVVTGDPYAGHSTPTGLFDIQDKDLYATLTGPGYSQPVTFWMPFDGGVGVHDASWRGSYGGTIYRGDGSHGCVNTPYSAARTIFNNIDVGVPVVVY